MPTFLINEEDKKVKKIMKIVGIIVAIVILVLVVVSVVLAGSMGGIGPFKFLHDNKIKSHAGNAEVYALENVEALESSPLNDKNILFLGSSVTKGACALDTSMADYIGILDGANITKEAVSGTTLATVKDNNYVERMEKLDTSASYDIVVVQLSTNDASQNVSLGSLSTSTDRADFDTDTVMGAIEYIISYCRDTWNCPVVFYTGTKYDSENYEAMVAGLNEIADKWGIVVIDLWNDADMNAVSDEDYALYMYDGIHPSQAGYLLWWTPKFEEVLYELD